MTKLSHADRTYYGGMKPAGAINAEGFAAHDASSAWDDGGAAESVLAEWTSGMKAYGADQAKMAVLEYVSNAYCDLAIVGGKMCLVLDSSNNEAEFRVYWPLQDLICKALAEAEGAGDTATINAIGQAVQSVMLNFRGEQQTEFAVSQQKPLRPGRTAPPRLAAPGPALTRKR